MEGQGQLKKRNLSLVGKLERLFLYAIHRSRPLGRRARSVQADAHSHETDKERSGRLPRGLRRHLRPRNRDRHNKGPGRSGSLSKVRSNVGPWGVVEEAPAPVPESTNGKERTRDLFLVVPFERSCRFARHERLMLRARPRGRVRHEPTARTPRDGFHLPVLPAVLHVKPGHRGAAFFFVEVTARRKDRRSPSAPASRQAARHVFRQDTRAVSHRRRSREHQGPRGKSSCRDAGGRRRVRSCDVDHRRAD